MLQQGTKRAAKSSATSSSSKPAPKKKKKKNCDVKDATTYEATSYRSLDGQGTFLTAKQVASVHSGDCVILRAEEVDSGDDSERKRIGKKGLYVCVIGGYVVMPGDVWVPMRMRANVHLVQFHNIVNDMKTNGLLADAAKPLVLLTGGPDSADGKQTGQALCPGSGPRRLKKFEMLVQRAARSHAE